MESWSFDWGGAGYKLRREAVGGVYGGSAVSVMPTRRRW